MDDINISKNKDIVTDMSIIRMKKVLDIKFDKDLGKFFNVSQTTVTGWRDRNIPFKYYYEFAQKTNTSLDWLIFGYGERKLDNKSAKDKFSEKEIFFAVNDIHNTDKIFKSDKFANTVIAFLHLMREQTENNNK